MRATSLIKLFYITLTAVCMLNCRAKVATESDVLAVNPRKKIGPVEDLSHFDRVRVFVALCDAVYCGDDSNCSLPDRFEQDRQFLGVNFSLSNWKRELITARDGEKDIEGYVFFQPDGSDVVIAFRGSETVSWGIFQDWITTNARTAPSYYAGKHFRGNVHQGFLNGMYGIWHPNNTGIIKVISDNNLWGRRFWVTGYSMGASIATLVGMRLSDEGQDVAGIYTFGSPKLAQGDFQASFNARLYDVTYHFVHDKDPIPRIEMNLVSVGKTFVFDGQNLRLAEKDGVPATPWFSFFGDIQAHLMDSNLPQGYLSSVRSYR